MSIGCNVHLAISSLVVGSKHFSKKSVIQIKSKMSNASQCFFLICSISKPWIAPNVFTLFASIQAIVSSTSRKKKYLAAVVVLCTMCTMYKYECAFVAHPYTIRNGFHHPTLEICILLRWTYFSSWLYTNIAVIVKILPFAWKQTFQITTPVTLATGCGPNYLIQFIALSP